MIANEAESYRDIGRLLIACPDRPGIVAAVSHFLAAQGANIVHSDQHSTNPVGGAFFMRLESDFAELAGPFSMDWRLAYAERPKTLAIFTSRADHALVELLWRHRAGDLRAEILMVISNHPNVEETAASWKIPFYLVPVERDRKGEAEQRQLELVLGKVDTLVLARYMQVLSSEFIAHFPNRIINIHHSFLPAFAGADPYARASERGVKLIGATAHYVTEELDAGPIIEQDVQRVDHRHSTGELRRLGRYVERVVLARAVAWHSEDRVLVHGNRTVVFA